jgi:hypothetical protein
MRCVLIMPAWTPDEIFSSRTVSSQLNYWQPLGGLYVGASLIEAGHEVTFLDGALLSHRDIMQRVEEIKPGFAGLYSTTFGWPAAVETAADIKSLDQDIFTCVGGPYPTTGGERCLRDGGEGIDAVVVGEGELAAAEIVDRLQAGDGLDGIPGVIFRNGAEIVCNPPRPLLEDLDRLPFPARQLLGACTASVTGAWRTSWRRSRSASGRATARSSSSTTPSPPTMTGPWPCHVRSRPEVWISHGSLRPARTRSTRRCCGP